MENCTSESVKTVSAYACVEQEAVKKAYYHFQTAQIQFPEASMD